MGVLRLFRFLIKKYPEIAYFLKFTDKPAFTVDWLYYDLNAEFHPAARKVFYPEPLEKQRVSFIKKNVKTTSSQYKPTEKDLFQEICSQIEIILSRNPARNLYFAIDGTAGISKGAQQRSRRFLRVIDDEKKGEEIPFDTSAISTGTLFMERLSKYLDIFIQRKISQDPYWKNMEVIFSNARVCGEGEHKLKNHALQYPKLSHTVVSPDADLLMLLLGLHNPQSYVYRVNIFTDIDADYFIVKIDELKNVIFVKNTL